jgi:hypothetical protein
MSFQQKYRSTNAVPGFPLGAVVSFCLVIAIFALLIVLGLIGDLL